MNNGVRLAAPPDSVSFREAFFGLVLQRPVLATIDGAAVLLSLVALVAIFRFRLGMIPTLALCSMLGVLVYALR